MTQKDPLIDLPWPGATVTPSAACSQAIRGTCTKGLCAERGVSALGRALLTLGLCVGLVGVYAWSALTSQSVSPVVHTALFGAMGWLGAQALLVFTTLARPPGKRGSRALRLGILLAAPVLFVVYLGLISNEHFAFSKFSHGAPAAHAIGCGIVALVMGALIAGGAMVAWRKTDPYNPGLSGAMVGMVAGLASGSGMSVACASHEA
ncbi:MAG TPA: NrsF family protein, partial [Polyangiaceae bacterium]|nr:NrsF family protein [Polyangiaceae bacterium]